MNKHECFGILDRVFPIGEKGLRETTKECFQCPERISCLKKALLTEEGIKFRSELIDRSPASGFPAKIKRWSQKKELNRLAELEKKNCEKEPVSVPTLFRDLIPVLLSPVSFFREIVSKRGNRDAMAFGLLFGSLGTMFGLFWKFLIMPDDMISLIGFITARSPLNLIFTGIAIITPILTSIKIFLISGIIHLFLFLLRGDKNGFKGTFKVAAFSQATQLLDFIPFIGEIVGFLWHLIILTIGLRETHETSFSMVILAMILPVALLILGIGTMMIWLPILL